MKNSLEEYVVKCRSNVEEHFKDKQLLVRYIRAERRGRGGVSCTQEQREMIVTLINRFGTEVNPFGVYELIQELPDSFKKELDQKFPDYDSFKKAFNIIKKRVQVRQSPKIGVVVAYKAGPSTADVNIGWSLSTNGDFNKYIGIQKAIEKSDGVRVVQKKIEEIKLRKLPHNEEIEVVPARDIPQTVLPYLEDLISSSYRFYNKKKVV